MTQTIAVPERLVARLEKKAHSQKTSVEMLVASILDEAIRFDDSNDDWPERNARRVLLINQRFAQGLNAAEMQELEGLQNQAIQRMEAWDSQLLNDVGAMQKAVEKIVSASAATSKS